MNSYNNDNRRNYSRVPREGAAGPGRESSRRRDNADGGGGGGGSRGGRARDAERERERARPAEGGLTWKKMDLHLHTPASSDYRTPGASFLDILKKAEERGLDMIAFADHNTVGGYAAMHREIETLTLLEKLNRINEQERATLNEYRRLLGQIVVLPAFEFTATFGFHILGIFPENTSVRKLEYLLLDLNVPEDRMVIGAPEVGSTSDVLRAYAAIATAGGLAIAAHANSSNGVAMQGFPFGGQTKIAYTQDPSLAALEVTDLEATGRRTTAAFFNGSKPEYPRRMHIIQGSDAHSLETEQSDSANKRLGVGTRVTEILVKEPSFAAFKEILMGNDFTRIRPYRAASAWDFAERARAEGPNIVQSFHERAMTKTSRTRPILHDVAAFANTSGGTIYVGVNPDVRVAVHGVERAEDDVRLLKADIQQMIEPPISVEFDIKPSGGRNVIVLKVPEGKEPPYVYTPTGQVYVRAEDETAIAGRDEIINLVRKSGALGEPATVGAVRDVGAVREPPLQPLSLPAPSPSAPASERRGELAVRTAPTAPAEAKRNGDAAPAEPKATPVPTVPTSPTSLRSGSGAQVQSSRPASSDFGAGARDIRPERNDAGQERAYRPPAFPNLPPEKIKGKVQPMSQPGAPPSASPVGDTNRLTWEDAEAGPEPSGNDQVTTPLTTRKLEEYVENAANPTLQLVATPEKTRSKRRRGRAAEPAPEVAPEPQAAGDTATAQVAEAPTPEAAAPAKRAGSRSRRKGAAAVAEAVETPALEEAAPMEATVSSEHITREELVVEAEKPRRGRRRSSKAAGADALEVEAPTAAAAASDTGAEAILTAAEVEPGPQQPYELAPEPEPATRRGRSRGKKAAQAPVETPTPETPTPETAEAPVQEPASTRKRARRGKRESAAATVEAPEAAQAAGQPLPEPPSTGVEILTTETRGSARYHTMRDLRNQTTVHNVTRQSARRLWHYAILQHEHGEPALAEVLWHPELPIGLWRRGQRAGAMRYDLVMRRPDGALSIYYGVTEEGLHGPWRDLVLMAEDSGYEGPDSAGG